MMDTINFVRIITLKKMFQIEFLRFDTSLFVDVVQKNASRFLTLRNETSC